MTSFEPTIPMRAYGAGGGAYEGVVVDGAPSPSGLGAIDWTAVLGNVISLVGRGREGQILTEAIVLAGYAPYPPGIRAAYQANPDAIDRWAAQLDVQRILDASRPEMRQFASSIHPAVILAGGALAGALAIRLIRG